MLVSGHLPGYARGKGQAPNALHRTLCMGESSGLLASLTLPKTG